VISRRQLLRRGATGLLLATPLAAVLGGCGHGAANTGVVPVKWDRDTCTRCQMVLSDRRFAAEVRGGPGSLLFKFDDIGCAVSWLSAQTWGSEPATRIWVAALASRGASTEWLDARRAWYLSGQSSPMGYNFGALAAVAPAALDFDAMRRLALARGH
jgi:copper chaperone NosL